MPLSAKHVARLQILHQSVIRGRIPPASELAAEYQRLLVAQQTGVDPPEEPESPPAQAPAPLALLTEKEQAAFYEVTSRTIRHWKAKKAPLSRPADLPAWWSRAYPQRPINPKILRALKKAQPVIPGTSPPPLPEPPPPPRPIRPDEIGFDQTHRRMLEEEARLSVEMADLRRAGDTAGASALRAEWLKLSTSLGGADTKALRNAIQRGELVQLARVEKEYSLVIAHFPEVLRVGLKEIRFKLKEQPPAEIWHPEIDALVDELFREVPARLMEAVNHALASQTSEPDSEP